MYLIAWNRYQIQWVSDLVPNPNFPNPNLECKSESGRSSIDLAIFFSVCVWWLYLLLIRLCHLQKASKRVCRSSYSKLKNSAIFFSKLLFIIKNNWHIDQIKESIWIDESCILLEATGWGDKIFTLLLVKTVTTCKDFYAPPCTTIWIGNCDQIFF